MILVRHYLDRARNPECLVKHMHKSNPDLGNVFPGRFYAESADHVVQACVTHVGDITRFEIAFLTCTNNQKANVFIDLPTTLDWAEANLPETPVLVDIKRMKIITNESLYFSSAPNNEEETILFLSEVDNQYYTFSFPGWVATTCNMAGKWISPALNDYPSVCGVELLAILTDVFNNQNQITYATLLDKLISVDVVGKCATPPEKRYPEGSTKAITAYAKKQPYKNKQEKFRLSLSAAIRQQGLPVTAIKQSKENPHSRQQIEVDELLTQVNELFLIDGRVMGTVFTMTTAIVESMKNIFKNVDDIVITEISNTLDGGV
jgi:hypothetical protein